MLAPYVEAHERRTAARPRRPQPRRSTTTGSRRCARESGIDVEYRPHRHARSRARCRGARRTCRRRWRMEPPASRGWSPPRRDRRASGAWRRSAARCSRRRTATSSRRSSRRRWPRCAERRGATFASRARVERIARTGSFFASHDGCRRRSTRAAIVLAAGAWANAIDGVRTPPLRPVRGQLLHLGWRGRPLSTIVWGPELLHRPAARTARCSSARRSKRSASTSGRPRMAFAICWMRRASCCRKDGARRSSRRASACVPPRPTNCRCSESDPADARRRSTRPGTTATACCWRRSPRTLIADLIVEGKSDPALDDFRPDRF